MKTLETTDGRAELRAVTGPDHGRIYDHELVSAVQRIAGVCGGDKVGHWSGGVLDWSTGVHHPRVDVTADTTTLYASDRDVFLFLVDDLNPIEAGRLPDDRVHAKRPGMVLLHGGSPNGAERIAACWADSRKVTQVAFKPQWVRHPRTAPFKRNDQLLEVLPIGVVVFPGSGSPTTWRTRPGSSASRCATSAGLATGERRIQRCASQIR